MSLPGRPQGESRSAQPEGDPVNPSFHVVFVCTGNICRSPTAHGVFRERVRAAGLEAQVTVDSAGTHGYHVGDPPDGRSQAHARSRGYEIADLRARQLSAADFAQADLLLVMDEDNLSVARSRCPPAQRHKLRRFTEFCRVHRSLDVPDPYYGGSEGFEHVLDLVEDGCDGLLAHMHAEMGPRAR